MAYGVAWRGDASLERRARPTAARRRRGGAWTRRRERVSIRKAPLSLAQRFFGRGAHAWRRCSWAMRSAISPSTSSRGFRPGWALIIAAMAPRRWSTKPCAALTSATVMNVRGVMAEMWQQSWCQRSSNVKSARQNKVSAESDVAARIRTDPDPLPAVPTCCKSQGRPQTGRLQFPSRGTFFAFLRARPPSHRAND